MKVVRSIYQFFHDTAMGSVSRAVCPLLASIFLVPLAQCLKVGVIPSPPLNQLLKCVQMVIGPLRRNLKNAILN